VAAAEAAAAENSNSKLKTLLPERESRIEVGALLTSIFIIAVCGLIYELIIGTLSSYLLGDSVLQFSITIGFFLSAMGVGSFLSRLFNRELLRTFLLIEIAIGVIGGFAATGLFAANVIFYRSYFVVVVAVIVTLGVLIGLEIPLLVRIAKRYGSLRDTISNVLAFDYIGALAASLLFPLVLLPYLGLSKTSFLVGIFNLIVVFINLRVFAKGIEKEHLVRILTAGAGALLVLGFLQSESITTFLEHFMYQDQMIYAEQSQYQRIVVTRYADDVRMYLDNEIQFSSRDEYRYHESLVLPAMSMAASRENVLIIGGGDGMAMREVLKYSDVKTATLIDIDPAVTHLAATFQPIVSMNRGSLIDQRVNVRNEDGFKFLESSSDLYEVIIADLPDPRTESVARLYSREFYGIIGRHLARGGIFVTQASSPFFVRQAHWCIEHTIIDAGLKAQPYHTYIPAFGEWGFIVASESNLDVMHTKIGVPVRFLSEETLRGMTVYPADIGELPTDISTLENPAAYRYYLEGWRKWRG
jgi:spermidine synthase